MSTNWRQRRLELSTVHDREFDVRVSFGDDVQQGVFNLLGTLQVMTASGWMQYVYVGGIERASESDDIPVGSRGHAKKEHVHLILIYNERLDKNTVRKHLGYNFEDTGIYVNPRSNAIEKNAKITYWGWKLHHMKDMTKLSDEELDKIKICRSLNRTLYEFGTLPNDDYTKCHTELLRVSNKYGNDEQKEEIRRLSVRPSKKKIKLGKPKKDLRTTGRKKKNKTAEQMTKAKDRMVTWLKKRDEHSAGSVEWNHAEEIVNRIRSDYFED